MGFADLLPLRPGIQNIDIVTGFVPLLEKNVAAFNPRRRLGRRTPSPRLQAVNRHAHGPARAAGKRCSAPCDSWPANPILVLPPI